MDLVCRFSIVGNGLANSANPSFHFVLLAQKGSKSRAAVTVAPDSRINGLSVRSSRSRYLWNRMRTPLAFSGANKLRIRSNMPFNLGDAASAINNRDYISGLYGLDEARFHSTGHRLAPCCVAPRGCISNDRNRNCRVTHATVHLEQTVPWPRFRGFQRSRIGADQAFLA